MKIGQYKMANEWMREESATPEEALNTWNELEAEFKANRAMSQEPRSMDLAALSDDVVPGRLKDELAGNFDPSQETYEEYLQRINLERPFNMAEGGQLVKPSVDGSRPGYGRKEKRFTITGGSKELRNLYKNEKAIKKIIELVKKEPDNYDSILKKINSYKGNKYKYSSNNLSNVLTILAEENKIDPKYKVDRAGTPIYVVNKRNAAIDKLIDVDLNKLPSASSIAKKVGVTTTTVTNYLKQSKGEDWVEQNYGKSRYLRYGETPLKKQFLDFVNNNPVENFTMKNILKNTDIKTKKEANSIFSKLMGDIYDKRAPNVDRPVHYIDKNINLKDITSKLRSADDFTDIFERRMGSLLLEAYDGNLDSKEYKKARETLTSYNNLIRQLNKKYPSIAQTIEHPIPYTFLTEVKAGKDPMSLINTYILGDKENTFKSKIDNVKIKLRRNLEKNPNDKKLLTQLEDMKKLETFLTKETGMQFGKIKSKFTDPNVQNIDFGATTFGKKKIIPQIEESLKIREKTVDFFNKFKNDPKAINLFKNAGVGAKIFRMLGSLRKGNVPLFLKEMDNILKKNPALKDKLAELPIFDEYSDIKNQYAALDTGTMTDATYVDDVEEKFTRRNPITTQALGSTAVGGAALAQKPIRTGLGKAFRTLGTRAGVLPFAGYTVYDNLKKGENIVDATLDPWVGAELLFPNIFKENVSKITSNPKLQKLLKFGKYGRMFTPIGAGITAAGLGIDAYKIARDEYQKMQGMTEQEKSDYLADQYEDLGGVYGEGAAEGGRIGRMGGGIASIRRPKAIPPKAGPMPDASGLSTLYNRVKRI
jgi:transposase